MRTLAANAHRRSPDVRRAPGRLGCAARVRCCSKRVVIVHSSVRRQAAVPRAEHVRSAVAATGCRCQRSRQLTRVRKPSALCGVIGGGAALRHPVGGSFLSEGGRLGFVGWRPHRRAPAAAGGDFSQRRPGPARLLRHSSYSLSWRAASVTRTGPSAARCAQDRPGRGCRCPVQVHAGAVLQTSGLDGVSVARRDPKRGWRLSLCRGDGRFPPGWSVARQPRGPRKARSSAGAGASSSPSPRPSSFPATGWPPGALGGSGAGGARWGSYRWDWGGLVRLAGALRWM